MRKSNTVLVGLLREKELTMALAESMTCGLAAHQLCSVKGVSEVLRGSLVCYQAEVKTETLRIGRGTIKKYSAESKEVTGLLAKRLHRVIPADLYAAITGLAAPGGSESHGKPVGTVFLAVQYRNKLHHERHLFRGSPSLIRRKACDALYKMVIRVVSPS